MKEQFKGRVTLLRNRGVTLLELLITISLMGLIFALGMYPMLSQITLFREQRSDIILFDDANLAVNYIIRDAMDARITTITGEGTGVNFGFDRDPTNPVNPLYTVSYTIAGAVPQLELLRDGSTITDKLASAPTFALVVIPNNQRHQLSCAIHFQDPVDTSITTSRHFEVMLGRNAQKFLSEL